MNLSSSELCVTFKTHVVESQHFYSLDVGPLAWTNSAVNSLQYFCGFMLQWYLGVGFQDPVLFLVLFLVQRMTLLGYFIVQLVEAFGLIDLTIT